MNFVWVVYFLSSQLNEFNKFREEVKCVFGVGIDVKFVIRHTTCLLDSLTDIISN